MEDIIRATLHSEDGQTLLAETTIKQPVLMRLFTKQVVPGYCGVTSSAHLLSARHHGIKPTAEIKEGDKSDVVPFTESNIFDFEATRSVVGDGAQLRRKGSHLGQVCALLRAHGRVVTKRHVHEAGSNDALEPNNRKCNCAYAEGSYADMDSFRREAIDALSRVDSSSGVIVNFQQDASLWYGHFSPLAAYHEGSDCFLLLDTREDKPLVWVRAPGLFRRMNTTDGSTNTSRGYLIVD